VLPVDLCPDKEGSVVRKFLAALAIVVAGLSTVTAGTASAQPARYCDRPDYGWFCLYRDPGYWGYSIGRTLCENANLPTWFWDMTSSWIDNQYGPGYASTWSYIAGTGNHEWVFNTFHGGSRYTLYDSENDRADYYTNQC
jgi:hypothetical protein